MISCSNRTIFLFNPFLVDRLQPLKPNEGFLFYNVMEEEFGVYMVSTSGDIIGNITYERFHKLPLYKRIYGFFISSYKEKYKDILPIEFEEFNGNIEIK